MQLATLNHLRNHLKAAWADAGDRPAPIAFVRRAGEPQSIAHQARTIASEMGLRYLDVDLSSGLDVETTAKLTRPGPRLLLVRNLGLTPAAGIEHALREGARSLILIEVLITQNAQTEDIMQSQAA